MSETMLRIKAAIVAALSGVCMLLGWRGVLLCVWVGMMCLDWISGSWAAKRNGEWSSKLAREGLYHKLAMVIAVASAVLADLVIYIAMDELPVNLDWPVLVFPLVTMWYIVTELGSILENVVKMGATVPQWLVSGLAVTKKKLDAAGEKAVEMLDKEESK